VSGPDDATVPQTPHRSSRPRIDRPERLPDRYQLKEVIGSGGMGKVYRAHDTTLGRDVAVKVIENAPVGTSGSQPRDRFVREARAAARLAHPNIVAVHDADPVAGWLVMDLVEGESLRDIAQRGPSSPRFVRAIADQVLAALDAAHASGVVHRDIKPSNIIVDGKEKVTLVDFGVARLVDAEVTRTGESLGTPAYMAPEQLRGGKVDERTDLYGLAATLYELVSGERMVAFETPSPAALAKVKAACGNERGIAQLITRCLNAAPEQRIGSAREAIALLASRPKRWPKLVTIALIVGIAGAGSAAIYRATRSAPPEDPRKQELFALSQKGEHQKAELLWRQYVTAHPDDADAWMMLLLTSWWSQGRLEEPIPDVEKLRPVQREMLHGIAMLATRRESQAIAYLEDAAQRFPNSVEIQYALGEARWHGQQIERGVQTLEHAFNMDPRWQLALHHVMEYRLSRGETAALRPFVGKLQLLDPTRAATLDCEIAISERHYDLAQAFARTAIAKLPPNHEVYACLMQAQILAGDLDGAGVTAKQAAAQASIDLREFGGRTIAAELLLYRGELAEYLASLPDSADRQRRITLGLWRPTADIADELVQTSEMLRGQPIVPASQNLIEHALGRDPTLIYEHAFEAELRAYGRGLSAELHGELAKAAAEFRRAVAAPAKGDVRLLAAHHLARVLYAQGDKVGAKAACDEVLYPHQYQAYRAALVPDCVLWTDDPKLMRQLSDHWTGEFQHPSVVEIRRQLGV
jgi:tetratricopeptide (TPR) repeat protein